MEWVKGLTMALISTISSSTPNTPSSISAMNNSKVSTSSSDKTALLQVHGFLDKTLLRLIEAAKTTPNKGNSALNGSDFIKEQLITLSSSSLVADIQLLMTAISSKC